MLLPQSFFKTPFPYSWGFIGADTVLCLFACIPVICLSYLIFGVCSQGLYTKRILCLAEIIHLWAFDAKFQTKDFSSSNKPNFVHENARLIFWRQWNFHDLILSICRSSCIYFSLQSNNNFNPAMYRK